MSGLVFDTGALIALDRGDRAVTVMVAEARSSLGTITVPAGCVAQACDETDDLAVTMFVGPSTTAEPLEIGVVTDDEGTAIIHAMRARPKFLKG